MMKMSWTLVKYNKEEQRYESLHYKVKCRDNLNYAFCHGLSPKYTKRVYNFVLEDTYDSGYLKLVCQLHENWAGTDVEEYRRYISVVNEFEQDIGIMPTKFYLTKQKNGRGIRNCFLLILDPAWFKTGLAVSCLSILLRSGMYFNKIPPGHQTSLESVINYGMRQQIGDLFTANGTAWDYEKMRDLEQTTELKYLEAVRLVLSYGNQTNYLGNKKLGSGRLPWIERDGVHSYLGFSSLSCQLSKIRRLLVEVKLNGISERGAIQAISYFKINRDFIKLFLDNKKHNANEERLIKQCFTTGD